MNLLDEIKKSDKKPKDLCSYIAKLLTDKKPSIKEFAEVMTKGRDSERGTCIEALEYATQTKPAIAKTYFPGVIKCLSDKAPRVKWEAAKVIGNISKVLSKEAEQAIDKLLVNTKDKGTVVRWSTAFALGEIAKNNPKVQSTLVAKIKTLIKNEENNGVKNVYLKALKVINK